MSEHDEKAIARRILHEAVIEMRDEGIAVETVIGCLVSIAVALMSDGSSPAAAAEMLRRMADMTDRAGEAAAAGKVH